MSWNTLKKEEVMIRSSFIICFVLSFTLVVSAQKKQVLLDDALVTANAAPNPNIIVCYNSTPAPQLIPESYFLTDSVQDLKYPITDSLQALSQAFSSRCILSVPPLSNSSISYLTDVPILVASNATSNKVIFSSSFHQNSNSLPLGFVMKFLAKGEINTAYKDRITSFPGKRIRYEDELKAGLSYQHYFSKSKVVFYASYFHRNMRYADITKDALNLVLYGNKMYEDKTASLSNMNFENLMYNQFSLGIGKQEGNLFAAVNLSFLQGFMDNQLRTTNAGIYTAPYGEYIDAKYGFSYNQANEGASPFFGLKGAGFSGDVHVGYQFNKGLLQFDVQDLGLIMWGKESINYGKDTAIHFEGVVIDNILKINSSSFGRLNVDSIVKDVAAEKTHRQYNTYLPATVSLSFSHQLKTKKIGIQLNYGIQTRWLSNYYVMAYVKSNFLFSNGFRTAVSISGGGYSLFNLGAEIGYTTRHINFMLGTHNLLGLVAPNHYPSSSLNLRFQYSF